MTTALASYSWVTRGCLLALLNLHSSSVVWFSCVSVCFYELLVERKKLTIWSQRGESFLGTISCLHVTLPMQLLNWYKRLGSSTTGTWVARKRETQRKDPSQKPLKLPATRPKKFPTLNNLYSLPNALFSYAPSILLLEIYIPNATNATHATSKYQADLQNEESPKVIFGTFFLFLARLGRRQSLSLIHLSNLLWCRESCARHFLFFSPFPCFPLWLSLYCS